VRPTDVYDEDLHDDPWLWAAARLRRSATLTHWRLFARFPIDDAPAVTR